MNNKRYENVYGYCPTQKSNYEITVMYSQVVGNKYIKTGADCEYSSYVGGPECPIKSSCPLYLSAPSEKLY